MEKLIFIISLFIITSFSLSAQIKTSNDFSINHGTPYKVVDGYKHFFEQEGEILSVKVDKNQLFIQKYSSQELTEVSRVEHKLDKEDQIEQFVQLKNHLYFLFSRFNKKENSVELYSRELDYTNGNFKEEAKLIVTISEPVDLILGGYFQYSGYTKTIMGDRYSNYKDTATGKHFNKTGINNFRKLAYFYGFQKKFFIEKSQNGEKLLVEYRKLQDDWYGQNGQVKFELLVLDHDLKEAWKSHIEMPYVGIAKNYIDITIDDNGRVYILTEVFENGWKKGEHKPFTQLELVTLSFEDEGLTPEKIELDDVFISDARFISLHTGEIAIAGYFGEKMALNSDGVFIQKMSKSGSLLELIHHKFPDEIFTSYQKKNNDKLSELVIRGIEIMEDGSWIVYGEKFFADLSVGSRNNYFFQEIIVTKISSKGNLEWVTKVPKNQQAYHGRMDLGFYMISDIDYAYLLMIDNVKNIELTSDNYPFEQSGNEGILMAVQIDNNSGEFQKSPILDMAEFNRHSLYNFDTRGIVKISKKQYIFECYKKGGEDLLIQLNLK